MKSAGLGGFRPSIGRMFTLKALNTSYKLAKSAYFAPAQEFDKNRLAIAA
jgi:hypothetical protein